MTLTDALGNTGRKAVYSKDGIRHEGEIVGVWGKNVQLLQSSGLLRLVDTEWVELV